ncbi:hypothetical protein MF271_16510 [Deinococcus sp. KNUC1210]|uniref:hypothetical protein n=1 Tax=Deinococcus sp. KNUC1210 TaxID=2917691 RepID=UPI001EEF83DE|nr:hypothetical protein [Deinococcus sp. KNUC1210]ULH15493.1 hypothetical protein MF271_16510 [Deinococcus sp. KNUC1210]
MEFETVESVGRAVEGLFEHPSVLTHRSDAAEARAGERAEENMAWMQTLALPSEADPDV